MVRENAKKLYKEQIKKQNIPKNRRMTFSQFFKQYLEMQKIQAHQPVGENQQVTEDTEDTEDFDFENMVNINEITDEDVEVQEDDENS